MESTSLTAFGSWMNSSLRAAQSVPEHASLPWGHPGELAGGEPTGEGSVVLVPGPAVFGFPYRPAPVKSGASVHAPTDPDRR